MTMTRKALWASLPIAACLAPLAAFAADDAGSASAEPPAYQTAAENAAPAQGTEPPKLEVSPQFANNEVGFGLQGVFGNNTGQYGRYNQFTTEGLDLLGEFAFRERGGLYNGDGGANDTSYYSFTGDRIDIQTGGELANYRYINGLGNQAFTDYNYMRGTANFIAPDGSIEFKTGQQGTWAFKAYGDSISYTGNIIDSLYTVNGTTATLNGGVPPSSHTTTFFNTNTALLTSDMNQFQTGTRRDIFGGEGKYVFGDWTFTGAVRREHKEGTMEEAIDESWGGQAFTLPIDYDTARFDVTAAYGVPHFQTSFQYTFSHFVDNHSAVYLPFPAYGAASPFLQTGVYSLPPSTDAHYLTFMGAFNPAPLTRVNVNLRYGLELQDAHFAPNTADPGVTNATSGFTNLNSDLEGTTHTSLNAVAQVYQGNVSVTSRLTDKLDGHAFASVDGRMVSLDEYKVFIGGATPDSNANTAVFVVPQYWNKEKTGFDLSYPVSPEHDTKLTAGYVFDYVDRSNAQVGTSFTHTGSVGVNSKLAEDLRGSVTFAYSDRSGSLAIATPWINLGAASQAAPSGAYYQAPMTSESAKVRFDYMPADDYSAGMFFQIKNEDYHYPSAPGLDLVNAVEGIKNDYNVTVGPDVSYRPAPNVNTNFFYTYEQIFFDNIGNGNCANSTAAATCAGSAGYFRNDYTSGVHTVGASVDWKVTPALKLGASYTFSYGTVAFSEYNGVFVSSPTATYQNVQNYPDIDSIMHALQLKLEYQVRPGLELTCGYSFNLFRQNNWNDLAPAVVSQSGSISYLTPAYSSPNYAVSTIAAGVKIMW